MNQKQWIEKIPVIIISAESGSSQVEQAYELGVTDFIMRPYNALIVHKRVVNTILLYEKQKKLVRMVVDQIYEKEKRSSLLFLYFKSILICSFGLKVRKFFNWLIYIDSDININ